MTFRELQAVLGKFSPEQLDKEFISYMIEDNEFRIPEFIEIARASDTLDDPDAAYIVL